MAPALFDKYQRVNQGESVLYIYNVIWSEISVQWANRWDLYLAENRDCGAGTQSQTQYCNLQRFKSRVFVAATHKYFRRNKYQYL